ncbi:MAG: intracellular septation protein [Bacteriovoracaceae bacterium]
MDQKLSKNFFLISFLPAIAYWYLEENYPIRIAVTGGLILAFLEISLEKIFTKHIHGISKFNFFLLLLLGGLSLLGDEGLWFKLQPFFTGVIMGGYLLFKQWRGIGLMEEMMIAMMDEARRPPTFIIRTLELHSSVFFLLYGIFMGYVAIYLSSDRWIFFKTAGFYLVFIGFFLIELVYIRLKMKRMIENQRKAELLKKF